MSLFSKEILEKVHKHSFKNREEVLKSKKCACFHCFRLYDSKEIDTFFIEKDGKETVLCPCCLCDTIIGDAAGFELSDSLIDALAYEYLHGLTRDDMKDFDGPEIVILD